MNKLLNSEELEKTLIKNWTNFIDVRFLLNEIKNFSSNLGLSCKIKKLSVSRFEFTDQGFILWTEVSLQHETNEINMTIEFFFNKTKFSIVNHIINKIR